MRLEKLELVGFKSFLERTVLHFEPGITAIVGPNGSGKSNIFDAIRWVLGEQSVKEMRGFKMEDVIFNGTDKHQPLGMAEVSLTLSNEDGKLPIEEKKVTISRRIFRSGESEYLINHNPVRLKDINDLILGSGIGIDSYSMVGQGKIDLILSSKPEDRRIIFDEASGILKYKLQKKEATRKLEETENNLSRINDIIAEVKRQINSLERQANKAKQYKEIWEQLKEKEKVLGMIKINKLNKERDEFLDKLNEYAEQEKNLKETYQEKLIQNEACQKELKEKEEEIFKLKEETIHIEHLIEQNQQLKIVSKERIEELTKQKEKLNQEIGSLKEKLTQINKDIENFNQDYQRLRETIKEKDSLLKEKEKHINQISQLKTQSKENIERAKKEILSLSDLKAKIKNELIDLDTQLKVKESREKRLRIEELKCQQDKDNIQNNLEQEKKILDDLENTLTVKKQEISNLKLNLAEESKKIEELKLHIQNKELEKERLVSQKEFLEKLDFEKVESRLKTLILTESLPQEDFNGLIVKIKEKTNCTDIDKNIFSQANFKLYGEAKTIDFDLERLLLKIKQTEEEISHKNQIIKDKIDTIEKLKKQIEESDKEAYQLELEISQRKNQVYNIQKELERINEESGIVLLELSEVEKELQNLREKKTSFLKEDKDLEDKIKIEEEIIRKENEEINSLDMERETCLLEITQIKTEKSSIEESLKKEDQTLRVLQENLKETEIRIKDYQNEILECEKRIKELDLNLNNLDASDKELLIEKSAKIEEAKIKNLKLQEYTQRLEDFKNSIEELRNQIQDINNRINDLKLQIQDIDFKISNIKERLNQTYQIQLDEKETLLPEEYNEESLLLEIDKFKQKLSSLGTVNLVAIEEYDEFKKRYDFLTQQQQDLIKAKESLYEAIQKINRTAKNLFLDTFKLINQEFKNYFRLLFCGGEADLFLLQENDPLESGVEIIARPPGKKLQNISLLSGGEKALCAIAIIFAIFKVKPSPFCILDEVDAALDEANISRYANLLDDFSKTAQFIVITHNKKTLLNADVMYGITMEESGVSKIVSVKFKDMNKEKDKQTKPVEVLA